MKLRDYDWDKQGFVEHEYPEGPIAEFVNFFRTTKAWIQDAERVHRKVLALEKALQTYREEQRIALAATAAAMASPPQLPESKPAKKGGRRAAHAEG